MLSLSGLTQTIRSPRRVRTRVVECVGATLVIESVLPDPVGNDRKLEEVVIRNASNGAISLAGWMLSDADNHTVALSGFDEIDAGASLTIVRNGSSLSLNNKGDTVILFAPGNQQVDSFTYSSSVQGQRLMTGH